MSQAGYSVYQVFSGQEKDFEEMKSNVVSPLEDLRGKLVAEIEVLKSEVKKAKGN